MQVGFCNGDFHRINCEPEERFSKKFINIYNSNGQAKAIELHCTHKSMIDYLLEIRDLDLSQFTFISMHTPHFQYIHNEETDIFLSKLRRLKDRYNISNFVFHTDKYIDWKIFDNHKELPVSIENMDNRKREGKTVKEIRQILDKYDFKLTLDLQHCFTNDSTMKLANTFQEEFRDRIVEYHISGYEERFIHYPLFKTKQDIIIQSLKYKELPIILEGTFDEIGEHNRELKYFLKRLV